MSKNPKAPPLHPNCKCSQLKPFRDEMIPPSKAGGLWAALNRKLF